MKGDQTDGGKMLQKQARGAGLQGRRGLGEQVEVGKTVIIGWAVDAGGSRRLYR